MINIEKIYKISMICSLITILVMVAMYIYAGVKFYGWMWSIPFFGPTALFLLVIVGALVYSYIVVKREENDSNSSE